MPPRRRSRLLAPVALLLVAVGCSRCGAPSSPAVVRYDGGAVTEAELEREASRMPPALREQFASGGGRREVAAALVDKRLLADEARRRKLDEDPEIVRQVAALEERLVIQALLAEEERAAPRPTDAELAAYYEQHGAELTQPEHLRVARVLARVQGSARGAREKARARAEGFAARLRSGEAVERVAKDGDGTERLRAGDIGPVTRGRGPDPRLEEAAFALQKSGQVSPVLEEADGYYVLVLTERVAARLPPLVELRGEVENRLVPLRQRKAYDELLARLRAKARVEFVPASPSAAGR